MKPSPQMASAPEDSPLQKLFATVFGAYLGLALLKFGNPPIMERFVAAPTNMYEVVLGNPWPIKWAYVLLGAVVVSGVLAMRSNLGKRKRGPQEATRSKVFRWLVLSPLIWLVWQVIATFKTVDGELSGLTLAHFASCVACFYLGFFVLSQVRDLKGFWLGLLCGFLLVLVVGWQQQFGGLEETRQYFFTYIYPQLKVVSPDYIKKISSNRIFSTLFYPNALAGALLLLLPISLGMIWQAQGRFTLGARVK
ncbi:MAG TPA: hypothetical protein VEC99_10650, partial [Clostridia bacterium]|nr:hypothetical protein [Clostridia bacterium]